MRKRNDAGFTLVEVIVVAGIIAILAGILVPMILKEIDEARITRAYADARSISTAIIIMKKDTGKWPNLDSGNSCNATATFIYGAGALPADLAAQGYDQNSAIHFDDYLTSDAGGCYGARWKGPYLAHTAADPWGNTYIMNPGSFDAGGVVWILSAGPNGSVETPMSAADLAGDDIGILLFKKTAVL